MKLFAKNLRTILSSKTRISEKGQSLAEMVLGMTILVMLMSGVVDLGRAFFTYIALEDAAGEAALFVSAYPTCPYDGRVDGSGTPLASAEDATPEDLTDDPDCEAPDNAVWRAVNAGGSGGLINWSDSSNLSYTFKCFEPDGDEVSCGVANTDDTVQVSITYNFRLVSPIIPDIAGGPRLPLTGTSSAIITAPTD